MAAPTIYKVYYTDANQNNKLAGYLYEIVEIKPGLTSSKIDGNISLYDFSDTKEQKKHIFMKNVEYTPDLYVVGFWFSVNYINNLSKYTLFSVLKTEFTIETADGGLIFVKDSTYSKMYSVDSNNIYNMIAIVIQNEKIVKIIINSDIYTLADAEQLSISDNMGFVFGNNNNMNAGLIGNIGEIKLLNAKNFNNRTFDIDKLYEKMKYKIQPPTTTTIPTTTTTIPTTTTTIPTTTTSTTTTIPTTTIPSTTTTTTIPTTTTTIPTTTTTIPTTTTTIPTTTTTIPTTTTTIPTTTTTIPTTTTTIPTSTTTTIPTSTTTTIPTTTRATNVYGTNQDAGGYKEVSA